MKYWIVILLLTGCGKVSNGNDGLQGPRGSDGSIITFVQFCQGIIQSYPGTFPEIGMCINNRLYGVYSANNGFLVEIVPDRYTSNGINASCSFTILPNCMVQ